MCMVWYDEPEEEDEFFSVREPEMEDELEELENDGLSAGEAGFLRGYDEFDEV